MTSQGEEGRAIGYDKGSQSGQIVKGRYGSLYGG